MKVSCEIVKDLLPLYIDNICSKESSLLIEEHLKECDDCRRDMENMKKELPVEVIVENLEEAKRIKKIRERWYKDMLKYLVYGAVGMLILILFVAIISIFVGMDCIPK
jgi:predicted anti-sigma-YlaC factor YlaD